MNLESVHSVYFIGIGGIGMSALARYFRFIGKQVAGYDKTRTKLTEQMEANDIEIHYKDDISLIPEWCLNKEKTLVVYTPAVPETHTEFQFFSRNEFVVEKRAKVLGMLTKSTFSFAVAGTHGKTTTSAILTHILNETGTSLTAFLGGVSENFGSNFIMDGSEVTVAEADEFDRSFLHLSPDVACITSMDADHLDIYGNASELEKSFRDFAKCIKPNGKLFIRNGLPIKGITYGIDDDSDYSIQNLKIKNATYVFDVVTPTEVIRGVEFNKPGKHNLLNGLVAFAMAVETGTPTNRLAKALKTFKGVQRRFSVHINKPELVYIDDYAHHPTEINAVHQAVSEMYPNKKTLAIFQPHLYTRTRDFVEEFASSLSKFDEVVLLDIYPARELPIEGVTSSWLLNKISRSKKSLKTKPELLAYVETKPAELIITMGAGDIGAEVQQIINILKNAS
ncbi:UDP-N-acetylmuramate--L-alanine ligase [Ascidiimonas sp. W6]|uniref:UDP-N-acetylmuramate--L-alanine ligase n=1 Tax=Ascidiimonas meishanensis TaxID=3128903 RepID=UPI0030EC68DD